MAPHVAGGVQIPHIIAQFALVFSHLWHTGLGLGLGLGLGVWLRLGLGLRLWLGLGLGFAVRVGARYTDTDVLEAI